MKHFSQIVLFILLVITYLVVSGEPLNYEDDIDQIEDLHNSIDFYINLSSKQRFSKTRV